MEARQQYDVALSFAGEDRPYVQRVAKVLADAGVKVFFDGYEGAKLWGKDLAVHLDQVYRQSAGFVVPFISRHYAAKAWPQHEFKSALARAVEAREDYLLPVRFDDTELPGLRHTIRYLNATELGPEQIASMILAKLGMATPLPTPAAAEPRLPRNQPSDFDPYAEAEAVLRRVRQRMDTGSNELRQAGYGVHSGDSNGRWMFRVMRHGRTLYALDAWIGHDWGENTLCFYGATGGPSSPGSTNAHGSIVWDRERGRPVIKLGNMSLLPRVAHEYVLTADELAEAIWDEIVRTLAQAPLN